ncbi:hypothetical protein JCM24511_08797 [Saitozyma sp. JCM 24511]|nr:hypothetical protein JCM24511_08797 [Saitozyma sp. JCM 24511]
MSPGERVVPESPVVLDAYQSPEFRGPEASTSRLRNPSYPLSHTPLLLADPNPSNIRARLENPLPVPDEHGPDQYPTDTQEVRAALVLRHALRWAVDHGDLELITWLADLEGKWAEVLQREVDSLEDEDGWGIVGIAVQSSCGKTDKEEVVKAVVSRWGLDRGQRGGRDRTGWTPLHLAALISSLQLVSFLLSHGASPQALTHRGLTPLDLIAGMHDRSDIATLLEQATSTGTSSPNPAVLSEPAPSLSDRRKAMLERRRENVARGTKRREENEKKRMISEERERWVRSMVQPVDVDAEFLFPRRNGSSRRSSDSGLGWMGDEDEGDSEDDVEGGQEDEGMGDISDDESMLAFGLAQLPSILDVLITSYTPCSQPLSKRSLPANAVFLYARFAHYRCDETWLEELLEGTVERIEQGIYSNVDNVAYLSFWAYNATLLLHLLRTDPGLELVCDELGLLGMMEELINAIHVFVIRVTERKIDTLLDAALLDYEPLEDFDDIRMDLVSHFRQDQAEGDSTQGLYEVNPAIVIQAFSQVFFWISCELFNRILTRKKYLCRSKAVQIRMNVTALDDWVRSNGLPIKIATKHLEPVTQLLQWLQCQSTLTDFDDLIGTMQNMRAINPLQMRRAVREYRFEVDEGRMTEECGQYLVQLQKDWERRRVQMSVKAIQDEARRRQGDEEEESAEEQAGEGTRVDHLFDGTTSLGDFVPRLAPECLGELLDSRVMLPFALPSDAAHLVATPPTDAAFSNMIPSIPWMSDMADPSRTPSRSSIALSRPMGWSLPHPRKLRRLPNDFFSWLKQAESDRRHRREAVATKPKSNLQPALDPPLGPSMRIDIPTRPSLDPLRMKPSLPALREEDVTPIATSAPYASRGGGNFDFPSPGLATSNSLDQLREKATVPFQAVETPLHARSESFELRVRKAVNGLYSDQHDTSERTPTATPTSSRLGGETTPTGSGSGHYELARHRRDGTSGSGIGSGSGGRSGSGSVSSTHSVGLRSPDSGNSSMLEGGKKKWWKISKKEGSSGSDQ